MWLINAKTLVLKEFVGAAIPSYNILSHTWDGQEVTFQDMQSGRASSKAAFHKIKNTCELSLNPPKGQIACEWVWIDSCCIDKRSSAQLSEAINSMYEYYQHASTCFVFLSDITSGKNGLSTFDLQECRWFTRSWTLQELIAPREVAFFDQDWRCIGMKTELLDVLFNITRIDVEALQGSQGLSTFSIAKRMSWAAGREATREEDVAYSLLGIFEVNMPLLYGERSKAFFRLQEEIMRQSDDQSLFAWGELDMLPALEHAGSRTSLSFFANGNHKSSPGDRKGSFVSVASSLEESAGPETERLGFLAQSPEDFRKSKDVEAFTTEEDRVWTMTNKGIAVRFPVLVDGTFLLNCHLKGDLNKQLAIRSASSPGNRNLRTRPFRGLVLYDIKSLAKTPEIVRYDRQYFWAKNRLDIKPKNDKYHGIYVNPQPGCSIVSAEPARLWNTRDKRFQPPSEATMWDANIQINVEEPSFQCFVRIAVEDASNRATAHCRITRHSRHEQAPRHDPGLHQLYTPKSQDRQRELVAFGRKYSNRSAMKVGKGWMLEATVDLEEIVGQPMWVVNIVRMTSEEWDARRNWVQRLPGVGIVVSVAGYFGRRIARTARGLDSDTESSDDSSDDWWSDTSSSDEAGDLRLATKRIGRRVRMPTRRGTSLRSG